jgi:hypothetical protein
LQQFRQQLETAKLYMGSRAKSSKRGKRSKRPWQVEAALDLLLDNSSIGAAAPAKADLSHLTEAVASIAGSPLAVSPNQLLLGMPSKQ